MATITLKYNANKVSAQKLLEGILSTGIFKVVDSPKERPYNKEFCKKLDESMEQVKRGEVEVIKTEDLWK